MKQIILEDKIAIVTGAAQGIGRGIALMLAEAGVKVAVVDISDKVNEVAKTISDQGFSGLALKCDVADFEQVQRTTETVLSEFGKVDILVNNAGIYPFKPFVDMTEEDWDRLMARSQLDLVCIRYKPTRFTGQESLLWSLHTCV